MANEPGLVPDVFLTSCPGTYRRSTSTSPWAPAGQRYRKWHRFLIGWQESSATMDPTGPGGLPPPPLPLTPGTSVSASHRQKAMCGAWGGVGPFFLAGGFRPYRPPVHKSWRISLKLNFGKTVADRLLCAKNTAASGFPLIGALREAGKSAVYNRGGNLLAPHD